MRVGILECLSTAATPRWLRVALGSINSVVPQVCRSCGLMAQHCESEPDGGLGVVLLRSVLPQAACGLGLGLQALALLGRIPVPPHSGFHSSKANTPRSLLSVGQRLGQLRSSMRPWWRCSPGAAGFPGVKSLATHSQTVFFLHSLETPFIGNKLINLHHAPERGRHSAQGTGTFLTPISGV